MSLVVGLFCLFFSIWGANKIDVSKITFDCSKLTDTKPNNATLCASVGFCYWDSAANSGAGACVKDPCLETKAETGYNPATTNPCTDAANSCTNAKYVAIDRNTDYPCAPTEWRVYCANTGNTAPFDQCIYNFIQSDGTCGEDGCQTYEYGKTVWDANSTVTTQPVCKTSYRDKTCNETYGAQNCYLNPDCMIYNGQCVVDRCSTYNGLTSCDVNAKATNGENKCNQFVAYGAIYPLSGTAQRPTKITTDADFKCYYSGEKYPGSAYPYANPCEYIPLIYAYGDQEDLPSGQSHRCAQETCTQQYTKDCPTTNISSVCKSANVVGGITCQVASSSIKGEFCSDGRNDYVAPVAQEETPCGAASVLRSPFSLVVLLLVAFLMMLFN